MVDQSLAGALRARVSQPVVTATSTSFRRFVDIFPSAGEPPSALKPGKYWIQRSSRQFCFATQLQPIVLPHWISKEDGQNSKCRQRYPRFGCHDRKATMGPQEKQLGESP
jgi:hypothetical protein